MGKISLEEVASAAAVARAILDANIEQLNMPNKEKQPPYFKTWAIEAMLGVTDASVQNCLARHKNRPLGRPIGPNSRKREFSVAETRVIANLLKESPRPDNALPFVICIGGFKGGTGKSTTSAALTHLLTARGHRVLAIDTDPQGSLASILTGKCDHDYEMSLEPFFQGHTHHDGTPIKLADLAQKTNWDGLDVIISHPRLFLSEVALTLRGQTEEGFVFWKQLKTGIEELRNQYDVVVIDTAPAVSFTSLNCYAAANLFIQPIPLGGLEFLSCVEFWDLVAGLFKQLSGSGFEFDLQAVGLLPYKTMRGTDKLAAFRYQELVRKFINSGYPTWLMPVEIPDSKLAERLGLNLQSVAELKPEDAKKAPHLALLNPFSECATWIEGQMMTYWGK